MLRHGVRGNVRAGVRQSVPASEKRMNVRIFSWIRSDGFSELRKIECSLGM